MSLRLLQNEVAHDSKERNFSNRETFVMNEEVKANYSMMQLVHSDLLYELLLVQLLMLYQILLIPLHSDILKQINEKQKVHGPTLLIDFY